MIAGLTGHRPTKLGGHSNSPMEKPIRAALKAYLLKLQPDSVISGMALGFDQWGASVAYELSIPYVAAVPFESQDALWNRPMRVYYKLLLKRAERVVVVCSGGYEPKKFQTRNEWIVDNCDVLLACWDGTDGGTANCIKYAHRVRRDVVRLNPREYAR